MALVAHHLDKLARTSHPKSLTATVKMMVAITEAIREIQNLHRASQI